MRPDELDPLRVLQGERPMPPFTWEALERQLTAMAVTVRQRDMVTPMVAGMRKSAPFCPPELLLRELLVVAWIVLDEGFHADLPQVRSDQHN